jgi:hypothetical protein
MKNLLKISSVLVLAVALCVGVTLSAQATVGVTLTSGAGQVGVDPSGLTNWTVGGVNYMPAETFYVKYVSGGTTYVATLGTFFSSYGDTDATNATVNYSNTVLSGSVHYTLTNGGPFVSDLGEQVTINNLSTTNSITFFEYANFDLSPNGANDVGYFGTQFNTNKIVVVNQHSDLASIYENNTSENTSPTASGWLMTDPNAVLAAIAAGSLTNSPGLNTLTSPAKDLAWALSWTIGPSGSLIISKDKLLTVPLPPSALLLGSGLLGLLALRRKKLFTR